MPIREDYHAILGLKRSATADEIRAAYRKAAKKAHPDRGGSSEEFRLIRKAADVLLAEAESRGGLAGRDPRSRAGDRTSVDGDWMTVSEALRVKWGLSFDPVTVFPPQKIGLSQFATATNLNAPAYHWLNRTVGMRGEAWDFHVAGSVTRIFFRRADDARLFKLRFF